MASFEALYGRRCKTPLCWSELDESKVLGPQMIHDTKKQVLYRSDPCHVLEPEEVELNPNLSYEEEPVMILDREFKRLHNKNVSLVKILWRNHNVKEATWEPEEIVKEQYTYLFNSELDKNIEDSREEQARRRNKGIVIRDQS
ncbi:hypothetical protein GQ457_09G018120 [Hibiscus cannabinus]